MADTYFKRCSEAVEEANGEGYWCRCHGCDPYLPVPVGALLIEDWEAAVEQMVAADEETYDMMMGYTPEGKRLRMGVYLRAAVGEGER